MKKKNFLFKIIILFLINQIYSQSGTLDTNFGNNGLVVTSVSNLHDDFNSIIKTNDDKILVGGKSNRNATLISYNQNGTINTNFGVSGILELNFNNGILEVITDMEIQDDGKIVLVGYTLDIHQNEDIVVARINQDGSYDRSFGTNGITIITFGSKDETASSLKLQDDGKIIVAGRTTGVRFSNMAILRLDIDGTLDTTFSNDGKQTIIISNNRSDSFTDVDVTFDGKIIATGNTVSVGYAQMAIVRFLNNGELDLTFGDNGSTLERFCISSSIISLPSGKSLIAGGTWGTSTIQSFSIARFDINGNLDTSFGNNGSVITSFGNYSHILKIKISDDNNIYAIGRAGTPSDFAIAKYTMEGLLDTSFGENGTINTDFNYYSLDAAGDFIIEQSSITLVGYSWEYSYSNLALARYNLDNELNLNQFYYKSNFDVFPRITNNFVNINSQNNHIISELIVIDFNGRIVYRKYDLNLKNFTLNLEELNTGLYFLKINKLSKAYKIILK
jgi:uncharacterized delta-60 repeat protein